MARAGLKTGSSSLLLGLWGDFTTRPKATMPMGFPHEQDLHAGFSKKGRLAVTKCGDRGCVRPGVQPGKLHVQLTDTVVDADPRPSPVPGSAWLIL